MTVGKDRSFGVYGEEEWLAWRRRGIGGSDAPVIMGLSPYRGLLALYVDKKDLGLDPREPTEAAYWGQQLEEMVAREFERRSGLRVAEPPGDKLVQHPEIPWLIGTPDRIVYDPVTGVRLGLLECKTTSARRDEVWEDGPAEAAVCQLQHYLAVTGDLRGWIACLIGGQRYVHFEIDRDDEYIAELLAKEAEFWRHVENNIPPEPDGRDSTTSIINTRFADAVANSAVELDGPALDAYHQLQALTSEPTAAEVDRLKNIIRVHLGRNEIGLVDGRPVVSWRPQTRKLFDVKTFTREHPDLARAYGRESTSRVFRTHDRRKPGDIQYEDDA